MSLEAVQGICENLTPAMSAQIVGYARSVEEVGPEIFRDAGIPYDRQVADTLVFIAGIRKFYAICSSVFWTVDNSLALLRQSGVQDVKIGSSDYSQNSELYLSLRSVNSELEEFLAGEGILDFMRMSYADIVRTLANGRQ